jgi:NAD(P)H-quinone oxidoreductase subunit 5
MVLPMVSLTVIVLLTPLLMQRIDPIPGINAFPLAVGLGVSASGLVGVLLGVWMPLDQLRSRSRVQAIRSLQDLLAFDFYTDRIYRATIVASVANLARFTNWLDQRLVNGLVNGIGRASLQSAESLKLGVSGQLQSYVLTVIVSIVLSLTGLIWFARAEVLP